MRSSRPRIRPSTAVSTSSAELIQTKIDKFVKDIETNNEEEVRTEVTRFGVKVIDAISTDNWTPMGMAATRGNVRLLKLLKSNGGDVNFTNKDGLTPLMIAAIKNNIACLELLIGKEATLDKKHKDGDTALHFAAYYGHKVCVDRLLNAGASSTILNDNGETASAIASAEIKALLHDAVPTSSVGPSQAKIDKFVDDIQVNNEEEIHKAITRFGVNVIDEISTTDRTPMGMAAGKGSVHMLKLLKSNGGDVNFTNKAGQTPLMMAANCNKVECLDWLIGEEAILDIQDTVSKTALHFAVEQDNKDCVTLLLKAGASKRTSELKTTPLSQVQGNKNYKRPLASMIKEKEDRLQSMITACSNPDIRELLEIDKFVGDIEGNNELAVQSTIGRLGVRVIDAISTTDRTPMGMAAAIGSVHMLKLLKSNGGDVNFTNKAGETPLMMAVNCNKVECLDWLIGQGADTDVQTKGGDTALHYAATFDYKDCVLRLLRAGASSTILNNSGRDARRETSNSDIKDLLKELRTPGIVALLSSDVAGIERSLTQGLDISIGTPVGRTFYNLLEESSKHLLVRVDFPCETLMANHAKLWFIIIKTDDLAGIGEKVESYVIRFPKLKKVKNEMGQKAVDMATSTNKEHILKAFLIHRRYRIISRRPEHMSDTCLIYRALDKLDQDEQGNPRPVALKLMRVYAQFDREIVARRRHNLDNKYVIKIFRTHPDVDASGTGISKPDVDPSVVEKAFSGDTSRDVLEQFYCLVMPLAERNLLVAIKQERFARVDMREVCHVFTRLVQCISHMHKCGVLHADFKPLNSVRINSRWYVIDLDASVVIGRDTVGRKFSSAYVPPEAIYVDNARNIAVVRSEKDRELTGVLVAHSSFDVWSLGCIFYKLCTGASLFKEGQDDNLSGDRNDPDSLWVLAEWSDFTKTLKLAKIDDGQEWSDNTKTLKLARNLASVMLEKDPAKRATLARVLTHPFITGQGVVRLVGTPARYDVFLSYRVDSDLTHAELLYKLLTKRGLSVWWDKKRLEPGQPWKEGFCRGLVASRFFVCLWSKDAINHPTIDRQSFARLTEDSPIDNVLLEHMLALELLSLGFLEGAYPVLIGDYDSQTDTFGHLFRNGGFPQCPDTSVKAVKEDLQVHMASQGLGHPLNPDITVKAVMGKFNSLQGGFVEGTKDGAFEKVADEIYKMVKGSNGGPEAENPNVLLRDIVHLQGSITQLKLTIAAKKQELDAKNKKLAKMDQEIAMKDQTIANVEEEISTILETSTLSLSEIHRLQALLAAEEEELERMRERLNKMQEELNMTQQELFLKEAEISQLQQSFNDEDWE